MNWEQLLSTVRYGQEDRENTEVSFRSEFQRDYDRLIFSSAFRRMQNKTQVFPLPGSVFVHNRLTHSLEVASVGRSLGEMVASRIRESEKADSGPLSEIGTIVATTCLAHDMGNPPFGHSGEKALSYFFEEGEGKELRKKYDLTEQQWADLTDFEGNANALRLFTHRYEGRREGGFSLTYATLASLIKYPYDSKNTNKKYGYFASEEETFRKIFEHVGISAKADGSYPRHPLVYLMEAADDISYLVMDLEDAHKLNIIGTEKAIAMLKAFHDENEQQRIADVFTEVTDTNEQIAYLRAKTINLLATACADIFIENLDRIMSGNFQKGLVNNLPVHLRKPLEVLEETGFNDVYKHRKVLEIEIAGFNILGTLVKEFTYSLENNSKYNKNIRALIPKQYQIYAENPYDRLRAVIDFISGMTDLYALEIYRIIKGIEMPSLR